MTINKMFTGIIQDCVKVIQLEKKENACRFALNLEAFSLNNLQLGASIAVDGVCLTVTHIENNIVFFDVVAETLSRTTLKNLEIGQYRNIERSLTFGAELGGHLVSGHVLGEALILQIKKYANHQQINTFKCNPLWMKYILEKGFITLDGASLTVVNPKETGEFDIHFIPETLARTTFKHKIVGDKINLEIDSQTQTIVDTVEKYLKNQVTGNVTPRCP